jgi:hypothetical protein
MWREEREGGAWGPPSGAKPRRNPLLWGVFAAIGALLPPYHFRGVVDMLLPGAFVFFLILFFLRSPYAWHVLAAIVLVVGPLYVFLSLEWRLVLFFHPGVTWVHVAFILIGLFLVLYCRKPYFAYLEGEKNARI